MRALGSYTVPFLCLFIGANSFAVKGTTDQCPEYYGAIPSPTKKEPDPPAAQALASAIQEMEATGSERMFPARTFGDDVRRLARQGDASFLQNMRPENIQESQTRMVQILDPATLAGSHRDSGLVMSRGDVFLEGYFRNSRFNRQTESLETFSGFTRSQPWFKHEASSGRYIAQTSGAQERLLRNLVNQQGSQITLYRGFRSENEAAFFRHLLAIRDGTLNPSARLELENILTTYAARNSVNPAVNRAYEQALEQLRSPTLDRDKTIRQLLLARFGEGQSAPENLFFSDRIDVARRYSGRNLPVLRLEIPPSTLRREAESGRAFIGVEYDYTEILIREAQGVEAIVPKLTLDYVP